MIDGDSRPVHSQRWWRWLVVAAAILVADQWSKRAVLAAFHVGDERMLAPFLSIVLAFNAGAAFSFLGDAAGWQRYLFSAFAVGASAFIVWLLRRGGSAPYCAALSLILGGALGNLWDRVTMGRVVDFVLVHDFLPRTLPGGAWFDPFPAFNVADAAITVGATLLIIDSFRHPSLPAREAP